MGNSRYVKVGDLLGPRNIEFLGDVQTDKKGHYGMFKCPDCGQSFISRIDHIKQGSTIRCKNCRVKAQSGDKNPNFKDLTGKRYGKLTVLEDGGIIYVGKKNPTKRRIWKCQCDCGNICYESTNVLERGLVNSCGKCDLHSNGEYAIQQILLNNNVKFENQKKFDSCVNIHQLRFDFYLPDFNCCIEYDGTSHYKSNPYGSWNTEESVKQTQERDEIKNQWCKDNSIALIRIPYTHLKEITLDDLLPETSNFLLK